MKHPRAAAAARPVTVLLLALALYAGTEAAWRLGMAPSGSAFAGGAVTITRQYSPSAQAAVTSSAGDNNGFQTSPTNALASDNLYASDSNSGLDDNATCTDIGTDKHRFSTYGIVLPSGSTVAGITVLLDMKVDNLTDTPFTCVRLSWNAGTSMTAEEQNYLGSTNEVTYTYGGAADNWGRTWSAAELNDTNFRVEVINGDEDPRVRSSVRDFSLDWIPVTVSFTAPWDSYTTSARTTVSDNFSGSPKTVYMKGSGYSTADTYKVAYYDAGGTKRFEEGPLTASGGTLNSAVTTSNYPTASAGSWRAVVQRSGASAFPAAYSSLNHDTNEVLGIDTFTVQATALPAFPGPAAAAVSALLAAAGYFVTRRRFAARRPA